MVNDVRQTDGRRLDGELKKGLGDMIKMAAMPIYGKSLKNSYKSNRIAMNRNCSNQKANPALKTKTGNK